MNLLITIYDKYKIPIAKRVSQFIDNGNFSLVSNEAANIARKNFDRFEWNKVRFANYPINWNEIPPLDDEVISNMAIYESISLKMMDRLRGVDLSFENRKRMYYRHLRFWNYYLDFKKIDVFISMSPPHDIYDYVIYCLCKLKGIETLFFYVMPTIPEKNELIYINKDIEKQGYIAYQRYLKLAEKYKEYDVKKTILQDNMQAFLNYYQRDVKELESYIGSRPQKFGKKVSIKEIIKYSYFFLKKHTDQFHQIFEILNKVKINELLSYYKSITIQPDYRSEYIYLPLHYQPEASTSPLAGIYTDQYLICEMLSYFSRENVNVYVKEHPRISKFRSKKFYEEILALPNVYFISQDENPYKLIDNSIAVATGTGTAGWESFIRGKPVLMFGYRNYQYAPGVYQIRKLSDCENALRDIRSQNYRVSNKQIILFMKALEEDVIEGYISANRIDKSPLSEEESLNNIYNEIVAKLKTIERENVPQ